MSSIAIPDTAPRPRKARGGSDSPPVSGFNPDDVTTVDEKLAAFRADNPEGTFRTTLTVDTDPILGLPRYTVQASVWWSNAAASNGDAPVVTAHATRTLNDDDGPWGLAPLETAESVAIARALRFLGYGKDNTDATG